MAKRSRVGDATPNTIIQTKGERLKRRRTSGGEKEVGRHSKLALDEDITNHNNNNSDLVIVAEEELANNIDEKIIAPSKSWSLSRAIAGHFSNLDPVFSSDEQYIFVGLDTAIHVYSVATSRLFRILQISPGASIVGFKLSPTKDEHLHIFTSSGIVSKWDWISGKRVAHWNTHLKTLSADLIYTETENNSPDMLFSLRERKDGNKEIAVMRLRDEERELHCQVILETNARIDYLRISGQGRTVVAYGGAQVCFGTVNPSNGSDFPQYTWSEVKLPFNITCVDIRQTKTPGLTQRMALDDERDMEEIDVAFGGADGSILVYHDALGFIGAGNILENRSLAPRRLHWHRNFVKAVRWSSDGNYLISGGQESVMVLWQLDTGRKQFLPHLSSPICNIVVPPSGNSYAVKLADNRIMVLSARELQPLVTIIGLQLRSRVAKSTGQTMLKAYPSQAVTAVLHPNNPDQLLITVPASHQVAQEGTSTTSPVLQTYDIRSNSHISRQALTRTNATTLNISPDGTQIIAPDVTHLSLSHDGKWMATIDKWRSHPRDVEALDIENNSAGGIYTDEEIHLKFWKWVSSSGLWELVTRVDTPHFSERSSVPVLDLASRPQAQEFATIGTDAVLRFWRPTVKVRSGLKPENADQLPETWKCRNTLDLGGYIEHCGFNLTSASICFSQDGSVLAVCMQSTSVNPGSTILIDVQHGCVKLSRVGVFSGDICASSFLGSYLIIATNESAFIWDTVDDAVMTTALDSNEPYLLAVNIKTQTFALASRRTQKKSSSKKLRKIRSSIQVYDVQSASLLSQSTPVKDPVALLSSPLSGDYVVVDSAANVQRLGSACKTVQPTNTEDLVKQSSSGLSGLFRLQNLDNGLSGSTVTANAYTRPLEGGGLSRVFGDSPPFVLPPSRIIFRDLVKALSA